MDGVNNARDTTPRAGLPGERTTREPGNIWYRPALHHVLRARSLRASLGSMRNGR